MLGLCSTNLMFASPASAQMSRETQQILDETDALLIECQQNSPTYRTAKTTRNECS